MPRINVEDTWNVDPRRSALAKLLGCDEMADGVALKLWKMSQTYFREGRLIPHSVFESYEHGPSFLKVGLAESQEDGVYIKGQCHHFSWIESRKNAGKNGGKQTQANSSKAKQTQASSSSSSSSSDRTKNSSTPKKGNKDWPELKPIVIAQAQKDHGFSDEFCERLWTRLLAYDQDKPYARRLSAATNWFNSERTIEDWKRIAPKRDPFIDHLAEEHAKMVAERKARLEQV